MDTPELLAHPVETLHNLVSPSHRQHVEAGKKGAAVRQQKRRAMQARGRSLATSKKRSTTGRTGAAKRKTASASRARSRTLATSKKRATGRKSRR